MTSDGNSPWEGDYFRPDETDEWTSLANGRSGGSCQPVRSDNRWACGSCRSCGDGPLPDGSCSQVSEVISRSRSPRRIRNRWVTACVVMVTGLLMIGIGGPWGESFIAPGPLCTQHARLFEDRQESQATAERCSACHASAKQSGNSIWAQLGVHPTVGAVRSDKCLACHGDHLGQAPKLAHGRFPDKSGGGGLIRNVGWGPSKSSRTNGHAELECTYCHREHQGAAYDLAFMSDRQCQTCHQQTFDSFEDGHPEFSMWPERRARSLHFDHQSHANLHFAESQRAFECASCHRLDAAENVVEVLPFEDSCASCHAQKIRVAGLQGIALFRLPAINRTLLGTENDVVGDWPLDNSKFFDGQLGQLQLWLLEADQDARSALESLQIDGDFALLEPESDSTPKAIAAVAVGLKRLLRELANQDRDALATRLSVVTGLKPNDAAITKVLDELPYEALREAQQLWLPTLESEAEGWGAIKTSRDLAFSDAVLPRAIPLEILPAAKNPIEANETASAEGIQLTAYDEGDSGRSRDAIRLAKAVGKEIDFNALLHTAKHLTITDVASNSEASRDEALQPKLDGELLVENPLRHRRPAVNEPSQEPIGSPSPNATDHGAEVPKPIVPERAIAEPPSGTEQAAMTEVSDGIPVSEQDALQHSRETFPIEEISKSVKQTPWRYAAQFQRGWARDDDQFSVTYYPVQHSDSLVVAMFDLWAASAARRNAAQQTGQFAATPARDSLLVEMNDWLANASPVGDCARCHQPVAAEHQWIGRAQWKAETRDPNQGVATRFSHQPHLRGSELNCDDCHRLGGSSLKLWSNELGSVSDFLPMNKEQCASCHRRGRSANSCTTCHDYHIGGTRLVDH